MAKRTTSKAKVEAEKTQEMPAVDVAPPLPDDTEIQHIIHEGTGEMRQVLARQGYAPVPMPAGYRLATADEVKAA